jgi:enoyl-CoA hydratase/carnithine racemase
VVGAQRSLIDATLEWILPLIEAAPLAQKEALRAIDASSDAMLDEGLDIEKAAYRAVLRTSDRNEALAAFAEKRKPVFVGK